MQTVCYRIHRFTMYTLFLVILGFLRVRAPACARKCIGLVTDRVEETRREWRQKMSTIGSYSVSTVQRYFICFKFNASYTSLNICVIVVYNFRSERKS